MELAVLAQNTNKQLDEILGLVREQRDDHELELFRADDTVWITVNNILVRVMMTVEGAQCDMDSEALIKDLDEAHLDSCHAFFNEADRLLLIHGHLLV